MSTGIINDIALTVDGPTMGLRPGERVECYHQVTGAVAWQGTVRAATPRKSTVQPDGKAHVRHFTARGMLSAYAGGGDVPPLRLRRLP